MSVSKHSATRYVCDGCGKVRHVPVNEPPIGFWSHGNGYECSNCHQSRIALLIGGRIPPAPTGGIVTRIRRACNRAPQLGEGFVAGLALGGMVWAVIGAVAHGVPSW